MKLLANSRHSVFRILAMAAIIFIFSAPAFAYEEDTHFQMTYVICRSVGFTSDEALLVAAVDQGMDDSAGTVANGGIGGVIPNVDEEAFWHALDGYGVLHGGTMTVKGILARRDQFYQDALKETTLRNKLIRLGVFFHYQQDTWGHRHHYKDFGVRVTPTYDPNHLSRDNYTTYNTPTGHAPDGHAPDRPPFDPVAALMDLEDGIVYARRFLKEGLGREPGALLANYTPRGGQDDTDWNGGNKGAFFKQISLAGASPKDFARNYLLSLIRAQIDAYSVSGTPNPRYWPYYTPDEANLDQMRAALNKVAKDYEVYRAPGISDPAIDIPTTAQKLAQGFNGMSTAWLKSNLLDGRLLGVGRDGFLFTKPTLFGNWFKIENSGLIVSVDLMKNGTILGVGRDGKLWTRPTLVSPWAKIDDNGSVIAAIEMPDGTILGVGADNNMWTRKTLTAPWVEVTNSGYVKSVAVLPDGTLLGVGLDGFLFTRPAVIGNRWNKIDGSGSVISVSVMDDGTILGIGTDNNLFTRAKPTSNWVPIPNSGYVVSVSDISLLK